MPNLPHATVPPASIPTVFRTIQRASIPSRVTSDFLEHNGLARGEGSHMVGLLRAVGLVDANAHPTALYRKYRNVGTIESFRELCCADDFTPSERRKSHRGGSDRFVADPAEISSATAQLRRALAESQKCLRHDLLRPAHVSMWNGYVAVALELLSTSDFAMVRVVRPTWNGHTIGDLGQHTTGALLLEMLRDLQLCTRDQFDELSLHLRRRNDCAHPTDFAPTLAMSLAYVDEVEMLARSLIFVARTGRPEA